MTNLEDDELDVRVSGGSTALAVILLVMVVAFAFGLAPFVYYLKMWWGWWGLTL